jgi:hypothetical protein
VSLPSRRTVPWASIFRGLSEKYGWTAEEISRLTMYQALVYSGCWCPEDIWQKQDAK